MNGRSGLVPGAMHSFPRALCRLHKLVRFARASSFPELAPKTKLKMRKHKKGRSGKPGNLLSLVGAGREEESLKEEIMGNNANKVGNGKERTTRKKK